MLAGTPAAPVVNGIVVVAANVFVIPTQILLLIMIDDVTFNWLMLWQ